MTIPPEVFLVRESSSHRVLAPRALRRPVGIMAAMLVLLLAQTPPFVMVARAARRPTTDDIVRGIGAFLGRPKAAPAPTKPGGPASRQPAEPGTTRPPALADTIRATQGTFVLDTLVVHELERRGLVIQTTQYGYRSWAGMTEVKREFKEPDADMQKRFDAAQGEADNTAKQLLGDGILFAITVKGGTPVIDNARGTVQLSYSSGCGFCFSGIVGGCWIRPATRQRQTHGYYNAYTAIQAWLPPDDVDRDDADNLKGGWYATTLLLAVTPGRRDHPCAESQPQVVRPGAQSMTTSMLFEYEVRGLRVRLDTGKVFDLQSMY